MNSQTALGPASGSFHRLFDVILGRGVRNTFIKSHDDIRPDFVLESRRRFGRHFPGTAVQMGVKFNTFFGYFSKVRQAEDLEPAAIGQDWFIPMHKGMESPSLLDQIRSRP